MANLEAGNDEQLIIRDLVESYGLTIGTKRSPGVICAVSTLEQIYHKHGYHVLSRVLRLCIGTWEGEIASFSANILNGITKLIVVFGDQLNDEIFKERLGEVSIKQLTRTAKDRHAGSLGYAETMVMEYNGKRKNPATRLSINRLYDTAAMLSSSIAEEDDTAESNDSPEPKEDSYEDSPTK